MNDKRVQVHIPYEILVARLAEVLEEGLCPEVYLDAESLSTLEEGTLTGMGKALADSGLSTTIHGPYMDMSPGGADEGVRSLTAEKFSLLINRTIPLKPEVITLHAGYDERYFDGDSQLWLAQSIKTWTLLAKEAEEAGVVLALENIFETRPDTLKDLVEAVGSPNLRVCIDSGHLNLYSEVSTEEWFSELGPYIALLHIHDNLGVRDDHLPVGDGEIDFPEFFSLVREYANGPVYTIEPHGEEVLWRGLEAIGKYL
ncbi:MAG: sugar phosphate isomerase/epimerase family protein [Thermodesulfobacteriota bacterium]